MNPCRVGSATFCSMAKVHNITCGQQSCQLGYSPIHHRKDISSLNDQPFRPDHSYHLSSSHCTEEYIQAPSSGSSIHITWPLLVVKQKLCYIATAECWWLCKDFFQVETSTQTLRCLRRAAHCQDRRSSTRDHRARLLTTLISLTEYFHLAGALMEHFFEKMKKLVH